MSVIQIKVIVVAHLDGFVDFLVRLKTVGDVVQVKVRLALFESYDVIHVPLVNIIVPLKITGSELNILAFIAVIYLGIIPLHFHRNLKLGVSVALDKIFPGAQPQSCREINRFSLA